MDSKGRTRSWIGPAAGAAAVVCFGLVGLVLVGEVALLGSRPTSVREQASRVLALTATTTALVAGVIGGVIGLVRGLEYPPTAFFAFLEGSVLAGIPGLLIGACVGAVLAADLRRQARHA